MKQFFRSLIDLKFEHFITRKVAGIFYAIMLAAIAVTAIIAFFGSLIAGFGALSSGYSYGAGIGLGSIFVAIVLVPVGTFVAVLMTRLLFESSVALVAVAENTKK